jgi:hypothetical protein
MNVELIGPEDARWRRVLEATAHDVYHLPGYGSLYGQEPGTEERALYVQGADAELLVPMMIRPLPELGVPPLAGWRDATSPYGYPGPLLRGTFSPVEVEGLRHRVLKALAERRILACFLRGHPLIPQADPVVERMGTAVVHGETAVIELELPDEEITRRMDVPNRRQIRRLKRLGYSCRVDDWRDLAAFAAVYRETMRRVGAEPFYFFDDAYFDRLRAFLGDHLHLISTRSPEGVVVSAAIFTTCGGIVNGHLNGTATSHLRLAPAKLMHDETWRWAKQHGDRIFNFGGGLGGRSNDSLFRFKKGLSTATRPFRTVRVVCDERLYGMACTAAGMSGTDLTGFFPAYRQVPEVARPAAPELEKFSRSA